MSVRNHGLKEQGCIKFIESNNFPARSHLFYCYGCKINAGGHKRDRGARFIFLQQHFIPASDFLWAEVQTQRAHTHVARKMGEKQGLPGARRLFSSPQERGKREKEKKERHIRLFTLRYLCFSPFLRKPLGEGAQENKFPPPRGRYKFKKSAVNLVRENRPAAIWAMHIGDLFCPAPVNLRVHERQPITMHGTSPLRASAAKKGSREVQ